MVLSLALAAALVLAGEPAIAGETLDTRSLVAGGAAILGAGALGTYYDSEIRFAPERDALHATTFGFGNWGRNYDGLSSDRSALTLEWTGRQHLGPARPLAGGFVSGDGSIYAFAGVQFDVYTGEHLVLSPVTGMGWYNSGNRAVDLYHPLEFRSGLEIAWRWRAGARVGLGVHHLSNAGLGATNPGSDLLTLRLTVPMRRDGAM